jgi:hypothetical protein
MCDEALGIALSGEDGMEPSDGLVVTALLVVHNVRPAATAVF